MYQPRTYRNWVSSDLVNFSVRDRETDILVSADKNLKKETLRLIRQYRGEIEDYIANNPEFKTSLKPLPEDRDAPEIVKSMFRAARPVNVGPMAAVAGAINEFVGKNLLNFTEQVILENGGDLFIKTVKMRKIAVYAGSSPLSGKIFIRINPGMTPLGICTSSGTIGHSLSFGKADAVTVLSGDAALADACATAACNIVQGEGDIEKALNFAKNIEGVKACVVIYRDKIGSIGNIELT